MIVTPYRQYFSHVTVATIKLNLISFLNFEVSLVALTSLLFIEIQ